MSTPRHLRSPGLGAVLIGTSVLTFLASCGELPVEGPSRAVPPSAAPLRISTNATCTISWMLGVSGDWDDSTNWAPSRRPVATDTVCFTANGIYTVTLTSGKWAAYLFVDDNSAVTLDASGALTMSYEDLEIRRLGRLTTTGCTALNADWGALTLVDGTLTMRSDPTCVSGQHLEHVRVTGMLELQSTSAEIGSFENSGHVVLTGANTLSDGNHVQFNGGQISGSGTLHLDLWSGGAIWSAGALPGRQSGSGNARVRVTADSLVLPSGIASGAIDLTGSATTQSRRLVGEVPTSIDVGIAAGGKTLLQRSTSQARAPFHVRGRLALRPSFGPAVIETDTLVVHGQLVAERDSVTLDVYTVDNRPGGRIDATSPVVLEAQVVTGVPSYSRHEQRGTLASSGAGRVVVGRSATLEIRPGSAHGGRIVVLGSGSLVGDGTLADVETLGGVVSPGIGAGSLGTLTMQSLRLDPAGRVDVEVGIDTTFTFDRLRVTTLLQLAGTLDLDYVAPFTGGTCGQVFSPITLASGATMTGQFNALSDGQLTTTRAFRLYPSANALQLVGYDPSLVLSVAPTSIGLAEGGAAGTSALCLAGFGPTGAGGPTGAVTVTGVARGGDVSASPNPVIFTTSNWGLPLPITVAAIEDTQAEGTHVDSVRFTLTSSDARYRGVARTQLAAVIADNDPPVDLALTLVASDDLALVGEQLDARFRVTNNGVGSSAGSTFTLTPMVGLTFVSSSAGASCVAGSGVVTCTVGTIVSGANVEFTLLFSATAAGVHANTAHLSGVDFDADTVNNTLVWSVTIS